MQLTVPIGRKRMADIVIETTRLVLRRIEEGDAAEHYRLLNTPPMMEHLGGQLELHEIEAKHAKAMASFARDGFGFMLVVEKATGELVGNCGMKRVDHPNAPNQGDFEIGWVVRDDRWRRGYAAEAVRAIMEWGFTTHQAPHVVALTADRNEPSWRLMEKLGMQRREDLDFDDPAYPPQDNPTIQYALTRAQWEKTQ